MARSYNKITVAILKQLAGKPSLSLKDLKSASGAEVSSKDFYNYLFRLEKQELATKHGENFAITQEGKQLLRRLVPEKDNIWKLVIFDIPEKYKYVRGVLRGKLRQLHFKKWQNSIWVSPYILEEEIEQEFSDLGKKFFVRLIKTTDINVTEDLQKMFE